MPTEKLKIDTEKVSQSRKADVAQFEVKEGKNTFMVDEDCTNNQIDLEECIIVSNRYHPCPPPTKDCALYKNTFEYRSQKFAEKLRGLGYNLSESDQDFEFGTIPGYEILDYNDEYEEHVKIFLDILIVPAIPEPYKSFKDEYLKFRSQISASSSKLGAFKKALRDAACQREIERVSETVEKLTALKNKMKKQFNGPKEEFNTINEPMKLFFETFPQSVEEKCEDLEKHQFQVENKIKVLDLIDLRC